MPGNILVLYASNLLDDPRCTGFTEWKREGRWLMVIMSDISDHPGMCHLCSRVVINFCGSLWILMNVT